MRPWLIDAKDIRDKGDFDEGIVHKTPDIKKFLQPSIENIFFIVATKGFGKTLLLKAKRLTFSRSGVRWIPEDNLVDKPAGDSRVYSEDDIENIMNDGNYWSNIWIISIACSVLKIKQDYASKFTSKMLSSAFRSESMTTITDYFSKLISFPRKEYFLCVNDMSEILIPSYRKYQSQVAAFIDNIDEYFDIHLENLQSSPSVTGAIRKDFWYNAQAGLVMAIYQLNGINQHVKIFCSIRREAFSKLISASAKSQQIIGSSLIISYEKEDLIEIFNRNVALEPRENLVSPRKRPYIEAFVGNSLTKIRHQYTGEEENIDDYIVRHTLGRARDIIEIGSSISKIPPEKRTKDSIKKAVNEAGTRIAEEYISEISPHITPIKWDVLFSLITSNILSREKIKEISEKYSDAVDGNTHVFCTLYKIGLLGYVDRPYGERQQTFIPPGTLTFALDGVIPDSEYYILHPVLDALLRQQSETFRYSYDKWNIGGNGRKWINPDNKIFVVHGDVKNYSAIMLDPDLNIHFADFFKNMFQRISLDLTYAHADKGDSFLIADVNPVRIIETLSLIISELQDFQTGIEIRAGGDYGHVLFSEDRTEPKNGQALRVAARIEPFGIPNHLVATERFIRKLEVIGWNSYTQLSNMEIQAPEENGRFNLAKRADDPAILEKLFAIKLNPIK